LRQRLPRHSKVQLRPLGEREGHLLARVEPLGAGVPGDLAEGLVAAGLATAIPCS
jgi:endonuclease YncB( thermonuclease family)